MRKELEPPYSTLTSHQPIPTHFTSLHTSLYLTFMKRFANYTLSSSDRVGVSFILRCAGGGRGFCDLPGALGLLGGAESGLQAPCQQRHQLCTGDWGPECLLPLSESPPASGWGDVCTHVGSPESVLALGVSGFNQKAWGTSGPKT